MYRIISIRLICVPLFLSSPGLGQESASSKTLTAAKLRDQANAAYSQKDYPACADLFERAAAAAGGAVANDFYNAACCHGRAKNVDDAFAMLQRAVKAGYTNLGHVKGDSDLLGLHDDARWEKLLSTIKPPVIRITDNKPGDPQKATFVYDDVHHFLHAMTLVSGDADVVPALKAEYFGKASPGLKQFVVKYGLTAEAMAGAIKKRPEKYKQIGERLVQLKAKEDSIRDAFVKLKKIMPGAVYPPTYILVSDYGGIASGSPDGQLITIERRTSESVARIETLMIHELVHFQQLVAQGPDEFYAVFGEKKNLLALTIREGTAEFFAGRLTGRISKRDALNYVLANEKDVWNRFVGQMGSRDTGDWLWSKPSREGQPQDVGYALGLRIVESYYNKAADKNEAVNEILSVTDYPRLLEKSRYGLQFRASGAEDILRTYVEDFRADPYAATPVTFGVQVRGTGGGDWTIACRGKSPDQKLADVTLRRGFPEEGVVYFFMDLETLRRIDRGEISELTASGKARGSEAAPCDVDPTPGFNPGDEFWRRFSPLRFHFWTRGTPEVVRFGEDHARVLHGSNAALLYYERGLRTVWMQVKKGQHVNESQQDQVNPFDSMFVITSGQCESRIGGVPRTLREGEMLIVPKDVSHEFWNDNDEPCEWLLVMFGPGA